MTRCVQILFWMSKQKQEKKIIHNMLWTCIFVGIHLNLFSRQIYPIWKKGKTINKNKSNQFKSNSSTTNTIFLHKFRIRMSHCRIPATEKSHLHKKPSLKHLNFLWFLTHWIWYKDWVKVICHDLFFSLNHSSRPPWFAHCSLFIFF